MKVKVLMSALGLILASTQATAAPDALAECYRKADTTIEVTKCLDKEYDQVKDYYEDVLDRVMTNARELDRVMRKKTAVKALNAANKAFDEFVDAQCSWVAASYGSGNGAGAAELACRVNLYRTRAGAMDAQFVTKN